MSALTRTRRRAPHAQVARWVLTALWLSLPFTIGPALADALSTRSELVQRIDSTGSWIAWLAGLVAVLVPSTVSLTAIRCLGPATLLAATMAFASGANGGMAIAGVVAGVAIMALSLNRYLADLYVNGSSYGDERRFLLRTPVPLLLGPVELAVLVIIGGAIAGPMLIAAGSWAPGAIALAVGWPLAALLLRSMHGLSRRWLVFVPAGLVIHDYSTLVDSLLVQKRDVSAFGWAEPGKPAQAAHLDPSTLGKRSSGGPLGPGTHAFDLTANGFGRPVEVTFAQAVSLLPRPPRRPGSEGPAVQAVEAMAVLIVPACGREAVAEATSRKLPS